MKKIAVLIPTYKPQAYIKRCLLSLDSQSLSKDFFTVYIALNGPKEPFNSYLLKALQKTSFDFRLIYLSQPGVSNARNHLIDSTTEPYITFIDDDDVISENFLEELINNASPEFMSVSNVKSFKTNIQDCKPNYIGKKFISIDDKETSKFKTRQYFSSPCAKMLHRTMINNVRFDTSLKKGEDGLFMAEISKNIFGISKTHASATYFVYERVGSASRKKANSLDEVKRITYLTFKYSMMLTHSNSDKLFIASRIIATLKHLKKI